MSSSGCRAGQRPLYESQKDLDEERKIAQFFAEKFDCTFSKMPIRYGLDYAIVRGRKVCGFAEFKSRTNALERYDTYMLSLGKVVSAHTLTQATTLPSFLMVKWTNAIGYISLSTPYEIEMGGRNDRADWQDVEPVAHFKIKDFKLFTDRA